MAGTGVLGVQRGEERSATLMVVHSFCMGGATVFFETAASALFLAQFTSRALPYVYIVAAVVNTATGLAYTRIRRRSSFRGLMTGTLLFLLLSVSALRAALWATGAAWLIFGLLVWYRVLSILTDLEYWAVAARLYNVRQAKRLFGLIGSGEVVARITGAFAVPLLVDRIGVANLILLSALALTGCAAVLVPILRLLPPEAPARRRAEQDAPGVRAHVRAVLADRYLVLVLSTAALAVLGKYFVDYAFLEQMRSRFSDVSRLAGFFGVFSGVTQLVSLLTRALLSGRLLSRFGIRVGLLVMPAVHLACTLAIVLAGFGPHAGALVFWLVITNQGIYKTLKHPIDNPSFKVLYQPLRTEQRLSAQIVVEALVTPVTIGVAGAVMLVFGVLLPFDAVQFGWVMLAAFAAWLVVARLASREYTAALVHALQGRLLDHGLVSLSDEPSLAIVKEKLKSEEPEDVISALALLDQFEYKGFATLLLQRLEHPSPEVRRFVLERLEELRATEALQEVAGRVERERDPAVRAAALRCLCALEKPHAGSQATPFLDHADPQVRRGAMIGLLRYREGVGSALALRRLSALAASSSPDDRAHAALAMGEVHRDGLALPLLPLLQDADPAVRRAALAAAGRIATEEACEELLQNLGSATFGSAAASALVAIGEPALEAIAPRFHAGEKRLLLHRMAEICGRVGGPRAISLLRPHMGIAEEGVRLQVLDALARCGFRAEGDDEREVLDEVRAEAEDAAWKIAARSRLPAEPALSMLREALAGEIESNRRRILALLSLVGDSRAMLSARDNLAHESRERRAYALEVLDLSVPAEMKAALIPIFDEAHAPLPGSAGAGLEPTLRDLVRRPVKWLKPWTRCCALHAGARLRLDGWDQTAAAVSDPDALVRETAAWVVQGGVSGTEEEAMLTIEKVMILKAVQMFSQTPEEVLSDVAAIVEDVELQKDQVIFEKGDPGDSMYIIVSGGVRVYDGPHVMNRLARRDIFGELALLDPEPRSASVAAEEDTRLFRIDRETFSELMAGNISIVRGVLHVLCDRLRRVNAVAPAAAGPAGR